VAGWELLFLAPDWIRLLVVGAVGGVTLGWVLVVLKNTVQEYLYKQDRKTTRESLVNIQLEESQDQYQGLRVLFENLLANTSSDISNDAEDVAARFQANKKIIGLINENLQINPEKDLTLRIEKKVDLFATIRDYLDCYWDFIPKENHAELIQIAAILHTTVNDARYAEKLDEKLYSFYQAIVFSFLYKLSEKLKEDNPQDYLWTYKDKDENFIREFPRSAEKKALDRLADLDLDDDSQWIDLPLEENEMTDEEIQEYMRKHGLS
jgi:hypothetical protein